MRLCVRNCTLILATELVVIRFIALTGRPVSGTPWLVRDFLDCVAVPGGDADNDGAIAFDLALAGEAGVALEPGGFLDAVFLFVCWFGEVFGTLLDVEMAGRAGADAAAGVLDVDTVFDGEFEEVLTLCGFDCPLGFFGAGEGIGVFEVEGDGDLSRGVVVV